MPFTLSHPAIILPFLKNKKLSATALVVGSMSPDFEYFFRMRMQSEISHTLLGIFTIDFPLGFIVMFTFHQIIKKPLLENAPVFLQKRMLELKESNWVDYFKNNVVTVLLSFFNVELFSLPFYKIAQHLSSLVGLIWIVFYISKLPKERAVVNPINRNYWTVSILFSLLFIAVRFYLGTELDQIGNAIVSIISPTVLAFTLTGLVFQKSKSI